MPSCPQPLPSCSAVCLLVLLLVPSPGFARFGLARYLRFIPFPTRPLPHYTDYGVTMLVVVRVETWHLWFSCLTTHLQFYLFCYFMVPIYFTPAVLYHVTTTYPDYTCHHRPWFFCLVFPLLTALVLPTPFFVLPAAHTVTFLPGSRVGRRDDRRAAS